MRTSILLLTAVLASLTACRSTPDANLAPDAEPAQIFAAGRSLYDAGEYKAARSVFERIVDDHPTSRESGPAMWHVAESSFKLEDWSQAKKEYIAYNDTHPLGHLGEIENRLYEIGVNLYYSGQRGILGLGIFTGSGRAFDTFEFIIAKLDNGSRADDALLFLGKARILDNQYQEAADHFEALLKRYPESEWALEARFYRGWAYWLVNRGAPYDLRSLMKARAAFENYIHVIEKDPVRRSEYTERIEEARTNLAEIEATLAEKNLTIARFYLSRERPEAARWYLESTTRDFSGTEAAAEARELLGEGE